MRKSVLSTTLTMLLAVCVFGQGEVSKYGKVSPEEMKMTVYSKDSSAEAVFLFDEGSADVSFSNITEDWQLQYKRHGRIKILTKEGLDWANLEILLYSSGAKSQKLSQFQATIFNDENGRVVKSKVGLNMGLTEEVGGGFSKQKFAFPDCKVGSVIDFHYTILSDYLFNLYPWEFQYTIPVVYSSYTVTIPEYFHYNTVSFGFEPYSSVNIGTQVKKISVTSHGVLVAGVLVPKYDYSVDYNAATISYVAKNVPALKSDVEFVDNVDNYLTRIEFELAQITFPRSPMQSFSTTWESVVEKLLAADDFGGQLSGGGYMDDDINTLTIGTTPEDKMLSAFNFIRSKVKWNNSYRLFVKNGVRRAYKDGFGNSAEVNLNLVLALRKVGLTAFPVALSTRRNGIINPARPTLTNFNHVIAAVMVGDKTYLLDATSLFSDINVLPFADLNWQGRIIDVNHNAWVSLNPNFNSRLRSVGQFTILSDGALDGDVQQIYSDQFAFLFQQKFGQTDYETKYEAEIKKDYISEVADSLTVAYGANSSPKVTASAHLKPEGVVSVAGDLMYIDPCVGFGNLENPFVENERKFPVNFGMPREETYMNQFLVPEGYAVEDLPKPMTVVLPNNGGKFIYSCALNGNRLVVVSRLTIPNIVYLATEYPYLKEFFNQIALKQQQKVVLKKI